MTKSYLVYLMVQMCQRYMLCNLSLVAYLVNVRCILPCYHIEVSSPSSLDARTCTIQLMLKSGLPNNIKCQH